MQKKFATLIVESVTPEILLIKLNRPEVRNAIDPMMMQDLCDCWQSINEDPSALRCIIITGADDKAFCAGADLKVRLGLDIPTWQAQHRLLQQAMRAMMHCPIPIIAAVNGVAFGGGLEIALAADFIYAADTAVFSQAETRVGLIPGAMGTQNLPRACGVRRAKELCFTALRFNAQQALEWGIINKITDIKELVPSAITTAKQIAANAPLAIQHAKNAINKGLNADVDSGYDIELQEYNQVLNSSDRVEGISAFNEKREPNFRGE